MAFDDNKTRTWDRTTLNDGIYFEDEFSRVYDNLTDINGRTTSQGDGLSTLTQYVYTLIAGTMQGGLFWDRTGGGSGTMVVRAGRYEVLGKIITNTSDLPISMVSHCYGNNSLEVDQWYYTLMDQTGNLRCQPAAGASVLSGLSVNSISDMGGGVYQLTFRDDPDLSGLSVGMVFRSDDLGGANSGLFFISNVDAAGFRIQIKNNAGSVILAGADPVGSGEVFAAVPLLNTPNPAFDVTRQGYYDGDWRILGVDHYESAETHRFVRSYGAGYNKNDNKLELAVWDKLGATNNTIIQFRDVLRQWGNDYTYDNSDGSSVTFNRAGLVSAYIFSYTNASINDWIGVSLNANQVERQTAMVDVNFLKRPGMSYAHPNWPTSGEFSFRVEPGDVVRVHCQGNELNHDEWATRACFVFTPE